MMPLMGEIDEAWKTVTEAFRTLGSELKSQYDRAVTDGRPLDEIEADLVGRQEIRDALDPAAQLREDLRNDDPTTDQVQEGDSAEESPLEQGREEISETLAPLGESIERDDVSSAFDRARDYLEQAASTVGKVAKDDGTQQAAKDAASAVGDALAATFGELKRSLGMTDEEAEAAESDEDSPPEDELEAD